MSTQRALNRILTSLLPNPHLKGHGWTPLENFNISKEALKRENSLQHLHSADNVLSVARRGLHSQAFDSTLWNDLCDKTIELKDTFKPCQWVELLHIFKRIKWKHEHLYHIASLLIADCIHELSLKELSIVSLSYAYFNFCPSYLFDKIATCVSDDLLKMQLNPCEPPADPLAHVLSYTHLLGAFAKCNIPNQHMFSGVASRLIDLITANTLLIPGRILIKIVSSYASLGFRHKALLDVVSKEFVTAKLTNEELVLLKSHFETLDYENEFMNNIFAYRLGNSV